MADFFWDLFLGIAVIALTLVATGILRLVWELFSNKYIQKKPFIYGEEYKYLVAKVGDRIPRYHLLEIGSIPLFIALWYLGLNYFLETSLTKFEQVEIVLQPTWVRKAILSLFGGLACASFLGEPLLFLVFGKDRHHARRYLEDLLNKWDDKNTAWIGKYLMIPYFLVSLAFSVMTIHNYTIVTNSHIHVNFFWQLEERRYDYSEVKELSFWTHTRSRIRESEFHKGVILFTDGSRWETGDIGAIHAVTEGERILRLLRYVSDRSGRPVRTSKYAPPALVD